MQNQLGLGRCKLAFEQLKNKLQDEGLFDEARKKHIPMLVQRLGIVTSPDGAALRDILTVINRRYSNIEILIYPVRVQGDEAKYEIAEAIEYLNSNYPGLDALLVGRGGGSYQDLWAFNEETVARAIYKSKIPVISCVGHEVDFTIADFVADMRAPTPSAAAELVVSNKSELLDTIEMNRIRLENTIHSSIENFEQHLRHLAESKVLGKPVGIFEFRMRQLDEINESLHNAAANLLETAGSDLSHVAEKLNLISPLSVLARGYSICVKTGEATVLKDGSRLKIGDPVSVRLHKGSFEGTVNKVSQTELNR